MSDNRTHRTIDWGEWVAFSSPQPFFSRFDAAAARCGGAGAARRCAWAGWEADGWDVGGAGAQEGRQYDRDVCAHCCSATRWPRDGRAMRCATPLCRAMPCYAVLCCAVPCRAVLPVLSPLFCAVTLCRATRYLFCAIMCCAMLPHDPVAVGRRSWPAGEAGLLHPAGFAARASFVAARAIGADGLWISPALAGHCSLPGSSRRGADTAKS